MIISIRYKYDLDKIVIELVYKELPLKIIQLYDSVSHSLILEGVVDEELKVISYRLDSNLDDKLYYLKEKDGEEVGKVVGEIKLHFNAIMTNHNFKEIVMQEDISSGEPFYEVNFQKPPSELNPPPKPNPVLVIEGDIEELKNFIDEKDFYRGWNEGFVIGKSL